MRSDIVLRRQRIRRTERDIGAASLERDHQIGRLGRHVQAGAHAYSQPAAVLSRTAPGSAAARASTAPPIPSAHGPPSARSRSSHRYVGGGRGRSALRAARGAAFSAVGISLDPRVRPLVAALDAARARAVPDPLEAGACRRATARLSAPTRSVRSHENCVRADLPLPTRSGVRPKWPYAAVAV